MTLLGLTTTFGDDFDLASTMSSDNTQQSGESSSSIHISKKAQEKIDKSIAKGKAKQEAPRKHGQSRQRNCKDCNEQGHASMANPICKLHSQHKPKEKRPVYTIKSGLRNIVNLSNNDLNNAFIQSVQQLVEHARDVSYLTSLFVNNYCLNLLKDGANIPVLNQALIYDFASLIMGLGTKASPQIISSFNSFRNNLGPVVDWNRFKSKKYAGTMTELARSYETAISNHVCDNYKKKTLRYFIICLSDTNSKYFTSCAVSTRSKMAENIFDSILNDSAISFPDHVKLKPEHKKTIQQLKEDSMGLMLKNLTAPNAVPRKAKFTNSEIAARPHLYLPWMYHILQVIEARTSIRDSIPQDKASKAFVYRNVRELINTKSFPRKFVKTIEHHVLEAINIQSGKPSFISRSFSQQKYIRSNSKTKSKQKRSSRQDLSDEEKTDIDAFVIKTREDIKNKTFLPEKFTDPRGSRFFTMVPIQAMQTRYIPLNLQSFVKILNDKKLIKNIKGRTMSELCLEVFNLRRIGFHTSDSLNGTETTPGFTGALRTDGHGIDFIFDRPKPKYQEPLTPNEAAKLIRVDSAVIWGVDPGQREVFVACDGTTTESHRVRRTSTGEYYQLAGFKKACLTRAKIDKYNSEQRLLISQKPTMKTSSIDDFTTASQYCLRHFELITKFYDPNSRYSKLRFRSYINKQKALNEMSKRLLHGSKKYENDSRDIQASEKKWKRLKPSDTDDEDSKPIIIAYGAANFGNLRGNVSAPAKLFRRTIVRFAKQRNRRTPTLVVPVDEHLTSQICPKCRKRSTKHQTDTSNMELHPVLICTEEKCRTRWNRDHMASLNIRSVFIHMAQHNDERPDAFKKRYLYRMCYIQITISNIYVL